MNESWRSRCARARNTLLHCGGKKELVSAGGNYGAGELHRLGYEREWGSRCGGVISRFSKQRTSSFQQNSLGRHFREQQGELAMQV